MDPTIEQMLTVYAASLRRRRQDLEDRCGRHPRSSPVGSPPRRVEACHDES
jgi:hypothetical protein